MRELLPGGVITFLSCRSYLPRVTRGVAEHRFSASPMTQGNPITRILRFSLRSISEITAFSPDKPGVVPEQNVEKDRRRTQNAANRTRT
ncbi:MULTISPECIES: hypothetical protein, partial [unclassified Methanoculleus]